MAMSYFALVRKQVMQQILRFIRDSKMIELDKVCGIFSVKTGFKGSTIRAMIEDLLAADLIELEGDYVKPKEREK